MVNIAIFVSGGGTNCENIIKYFEGSEKVRIVLVVSNKANAGAIARAQRLGVPSVVVPKARFNDREVILPLLEEYSVDFIVLAGFLLVVPGFLIDEYDHRMINLHPALLPKYGGMGMYGHHVHEAVKAAGEKETGMTVHWVSRDVDGGEIIAQFSTPIGPEDTPDDIAAKEHVLEMEHFPQVIEGIVSALFQKQ
ncbi:MAG: phosphoribosylglycinamide formyltransferase [Bacteroidales bacterium]|jgi:phosphoribosylglycinamide formyltransferase-1|nr:phosphoribosylglycinamide formyltransferase [Bacteroidales bacterium]MBQ5486917.1 phosphoribosylglycinamide formyltransferase [Bacteroidales bacterium]